MLKIFTHKQTIGETQSSKRKIPCTESSRSGRSVDHNTRTTFRQLVHARPRLIYFIQLFLTKMAYISREFILIVPVRAISVIVYPSSRVYIFEVLAAALRSSCPRIISHRLRTPYLRTRNILFQTCMFWFMAQRTRKVLLRTSLTLRKCSPVCSQEGKVIIHRSADRSYIVA